MSFVLVKTPWNLGTGVKSWALGIAAPHNASTGEAGLAPRESLSQGTHVERKPNQELFPGPALSQQSTLVFKAESLQQ